MTGVRSYNSTQPGKGNIACASGEVRFFFGVKEKEGLANVKMAERKVVH